MKQKIILKNLSQNLENYVQILDENIKFEYNLSKNGENIKIRNDNIFLPQLEEFYNHILALAEGVLEFYSNENLITSFEIKKLTLKNYKILKHEQSIAIDETIEIGNY